MIRINRLLINVPQLTRLIGLLMVFESLFMLVPTFTCIWYDEPDWMIFGISAVSVFVVGSGLISFIHPKETSMGKRDGFLLTALVWIIFSLCGMVPLLFCSTPLGITDAFFECMSGFTTTGASTYSAADLAVMSHGLHIWRAMMQWLGGMGIILFTLAVVPMLNHSGGMQMFNAEVTGITHEKIRPRISQTALSLWSVYIGLTIILTVVLTLGPMNLFDSVCHAFGTISTGGYSTDPSRHVYQGSNYTMVTLTVFMLLGGINFGLIFKGLSGNFKAVKSNNVFRTFIITILVFYVLFVISIIAHGEFHTWQDITIAPIFQVVSTITSTGYISDHVNRWGSFVFILTLMMMFSGACAGSTSGGAKIDRLIYLFKNCRNEIARSINPYRVLSVRVNGKVASPELISKVMAFLSIYMLLIFVGGLLLTALGVSWVDALFSSFSCISNTGIDTAATGFGRSFAAMPEVAKWILSLLMLIGRLELFTILLLFTRTFWTK